MVPTRSIEQETLESLLEARSIAGGPPLVEPIAGKEDWVRCWACGHACRIPPGQPGICKVRINRKGTLLVPFGYVAGLGADPVEKKPFYHVVPGELALSFGMLGCDLHCGYCQNWFTSQTLRDPASVPPPRDFAPERLVEEALHTDSRIVVSTYNEPLITSEWAVAVFERAKRAGLLTGYVSNGNATPRVLDYLRPVTDAYKVDLKSFRDRTYRSLGAVLGTICRTLEDLKARGFWVEVVTLLVPGFNDSDEEIRDLTRFLAGLDPLLPWHVTAFHSDYKMSEVPRTRVEQLVRAAEIGTESGLRYVYAGNLPGRVDPWEDTRCHSCGETVIRRRGFHVIENRLGPDGSCPSCTTRIPGVWS